MPCGEPMRRIALFLTTCMLLMSLSPLATASGGRSTACTADVCINELLPNPNGSDSGNYPAGEWVELHNSGSTDIDLQGWTLEDAGGWVHPIDANTWVGFANLATPYVLPAGDYAIISENSRGTLKLNNAGETLYLKDGSGTTVHTVTTGQANNDVSKFPGTSPTDDFVDSASNTPGAANGGAGTGPVYTESDLRITEVMPNAFWSADNATYPGGEWVEVANFGSNTLDLAGWTISDAAGNSMEMNASHLVDFASGTTIAPGQHRIVAVNGGFTFGNILNNGGDTLQLKMPNGDITHEVFYNGPVRAGHAYVNASGNSPGWGGDTASLVPAFFPTPEETNPSGIVTPDVWHINEVMPNASVEWVEVHNPVVQDDMATGVPLLDKEMITGTGVIIPFDCTTLVICGPGSPPYWETIQEGEFRLLTLENLSQFMLDVADSLSLLDENGVVIHHIEWAGGIDHNRSICPGDPANVYGPWQYCSQNTPGEANPGQESGGIDETAELRISEIFPNPAGNDSQPFPNDEWIEIVNIGNTTVNLTGWTLKTSATIDLPPQIQLEPGDFYLEHLNQHSSFWLTNTASTLKLQNPLGDPVHTVVYDFSSSGMSLVADTDPSLPWIMSPWPTPWAANVDFENPYTGSLDVRISEVMAQCSTTSEGLGAEWIEFHNYGEVDVNLSRWYVEDAAGYSAAVAPFRLWNQTEETMVLAPDEYAVLAIDDSVLSNFNEQITLRDPNRGAIQTLSWSESESCRSMEPTPDGEPGETRRTLWNTPGEPNPEILPYDGSMTVKFTRMMPGEITGRSNDWLELTNTGDTMVNLMGWQIARHRASGPWNSTFGDVTLLPGESMAFSDSPANLSADGGPGAMDGALAFDNMPWLVNSGGALQLVAPEGTVVDAFVYGNGEASIEGWTGGALEMPPTDFSGLILMRGDGCGDLPDTNASADWEVRWLRLGASLFCDDGLFTTTGSLTPANSPDGALAQLVDWVDDATESIHVHVYQFDSPELFDALDAAVARGVECTVLLEGEILGSTASHVDQRGWAHDLALVAGCDVYWMIDEIGSAQSPYRYVHSKVAVADGESVWLSSGNIKRSTLPLDGDNGNRDWGIIIDSADVAELVLSRLAWDEDADNRTYVVHIDDAPLSYGRPVGWERDAASTDFSPANETAPTFEGEFSGRLLTCPDDCIEGLVELLDAANETIDLSLQYFDDGWHWGYGDTSPMLDAMTRAARDRGVAVRLSINGYYVDESDDIREIVGHLNHDLNMTEGLDVEARIMAPGDGITKLHNKGVIVDGETTLISSINWGSNSALRNREMGITIDHAELAAHYTALFEADWERLDDSTDTDGDGLTDAWELLYGTNRTWAAVPGSAESEQNLDPDQDGLTHLREQEHGSDPFDADLDDDCILDGLEVAWAGFKGIEPSYAIATVDADGDGVNDGEQTNCGADLAGNGDGGTDGGGDGGTENPDDGEEEPKPGPIRDNAMEHLGAKIFLGLMMLMAVSLAGAATMMALNRRSGTGEHLFDDADDLTDAAWREGETAAGVISGVAGEGAVILDGTSVGPNESSEAREVTAGRHDGVFGAPQMDGYDFPKWSPKQVQESIDAGWTIEQLRAEYEKEFPE